MIVVRRLRLGIDVECSAQGALSIVVSARLNQQDAEQIERAKMVGLEAKERFEVTLCFGKLSCAQARRSLSEQRLGV